MAIVSAGHALGVLNYVFLSSEGIKPDTRQAINIYRLSYSFVGFVCVQVCDHCSSMQLDIIMSPFYVPMLTQNEPPRQKTGLRGFRPGPTQIGLGNHRRWLEAQILELGSSTIHVAKTKALISCAVTAQLICGFVFAYAKIRFSHVAAQITTLRSILNRSTHPAMLTVDCCVIIRCLEVRGWLSWCFTSTVNS